MIERMCDVTSFQLNIKVKWLTLMLHIWEALSLNLSPETAILTGFLWFSSLPPVKYWNRILKLDHDHLLSYPSYAFFCEQPISDGPPWKWISRRSFKLHGISKEFNMRISTKRTKAMTYVGNNPIRANIMLG
jgi:hypothetical protein